jgi:Mg2+-importing ATPase
MRMAAKRVVVKRLAAIHDLGAMDVLCTDKTGTLTEARIALADASSPCALRMAALNAGLASGVPTPLDAAILAAQPLPAGWRLLAENPFGFERRRSSVLAAGEGRRLLVVKGAPEAVLAACIDARDGRFDRAALLAAAEGRGAEGLRLLGVAMRAVPEDEAITGPEAERDLTFLGFCAFLDPPKQSAAAAVARLAALGIRTKVISGDAAPVVRHLVQALGLPA